MFSFEFLHLFSLSVLLYAHDTERTKFGLVSLRLVHLISPFPFSLVYSVASLSLVSVCLSVLIMIINAI